MRKSRLDVLEMKIEQVARAVGELELRLNFLQNTVTQPELETLSIRTATANKENLSISEVSIPESIKPVVNELIKNRGRWLSANQIAEKTGRSRNLESSYLQKLFEKGYLVRQRIGRNVYYSIHKEN